MVKKGSNKRIKLIPDSWIWLGRLKYSLAKKLKCKCADIYITPTNIKHVNDIHVKELAQIGLDVVDYAKYIVNNFNQVRQGTKDSLLLVVRKVHLSDVAAIRLEFVAKNNVWIVRTVQPRREKDLSKSELLFETASLK